jgi:hypothetical protein
MRFFDHLEALPFKNKEIWKILEKYKEEMNVFFR